MAVIEARTNTSARRYGPTHVRERVTSGSARRAVATQSVIVLALLGLVVYFLIQDLEPPYSTALAALLGVFAFTRLMAVWNLAFTYSDAGLEIFTSVQHHWLGWRSVTMISEVEIRRQNVLSMLLSGTQPFRVLRIHRVRRPPITVRATRGIQHADLDALRTIALRNGVEWFVSDEFASLARERGVWAWRRQG